MNNRNNKGFTLIELLVVLAVIAACTGIAAASVSTVSYSAAKRCASELDTAISRCRIDAMSRAGSVYLKISRDGGGNVVAEEAENGAAVASDIVGGPRCGVTFTTDAAHSLGVSGNALYLSFDRETGALRTLLPDGVSDAPQQCGSISASGGGRTFTITFVPVTGAHTLEG